MRNEVTAYGDLGGLVLAALPARASIPRSGSSPAEVAVPGALLLRDGRSWMTRLIERIREAIGRSTRSWWSWWTPGRFASRTTSELMSEHSMQMAAHQLRRPASRSTSSDAETAATASQTSRPWSRPRSSIARRRPTRPRSRPGSARREELEDGAGREADRREDARASRSDEVVRRAFGRNLISSPPSIGTAPPPRR